MHVARARVPSGYVSHIFINPILRRTRTRRVSAIAKINTIRKSFNFRCTKKSKKCRKWERKLKTYRNTYGPTLHARTHSTQTHTSNFSNATNCVGSGIEDTIWAVSSRMTYFNSRTQFSPKTLAQPIEQLCQCLPKPCRHMHGTHGYTTFDFCFVQFCDRHLPAKCSMQFHFSLLSAASVPFAAVVQS